MDNELMRGLIGELVQGRHTLSMAFQEGRLSLPEYTAMVLIEGNAEGGAHNIYADDLQQSLRVSKPAISQMMKSLEGAGYIRREINPENRRKLNVTLTEAGRDVLQEATRRFEERSERIFEAFGEEKTRQLHALYGEFMGIIRQMQADDAAQ